MPRARGQAGLRPGSTSLEGLGRDWPVARSAATSSCRARRLEAALTGHLARSDAALATPPLSGRLDIAPRSAGHRALARRLGRLADGRRHLRTAPAASWRSVRGRVRYGRRRRGWRPSALGGQGRAGLRACPDRRADDDGRPVRIASLAGGVLHLATATTRARTTGLSVAGSIDLASLVRQAELMLAPTAPGDDLGRPGSGHSDHRIRAAGRACARRRRLVADRLADGEVGRARGRQARSPRSRNASCASRPRRAAQGGAQRLQLLIEADKAGRGEGRRRSGCGGEEGRGRGRGGEKAAAEAPLRRRRRRGQRRPRRRPRVDAAAAARQGAAGAHAASPADLAAIVLRIRRRRHRRRHESLTSPSLIRRPRCRSRRHADTNRQARPMPAPMPDRARPTRRAMAGPPIPRRPARQPASGARWPGPTRRCAPFDRCRTSRSRVFRDDASRRRAHRGGGAQRRRMFSSTKSRMAEDRLPCSGSSRSRRRDPTVSYPGGSRCPSRAPQNASSSETLVLCPAITIERFTTWLFILVPHRFGRLAQAMAVEATVGDALSASDVARSARHARIFRRLEAARSSRSALLYSLRARRKLMISAMSKPHPDEDFRKTHLSEPFPRTCPRIRELEC